MKKDVLKAMLSIAFIAWAALWGWFIMRELFRKGYFYDYKELAFRSLDGKRSYVTGDKLYEFIKFCSSKLPANSTFDFMGLEKLSIESIDIRRAAYYLYPRLQNENPDFILVFESRGAARDGYSIFAVLDEERYILKRDGRNWR